jgi:hypothetical protein
MSDYTTIAGIGDSDDLLAISTFHKTQESYDICPIENINYPGTLYENIPADIDAYYPILKKGYFYNNGFEHYLYASKQIEVWTVADLIATGIISSGVITFQPSGYIESQSPITIKIFNNNTTINDLLGNDDLTFASGVSFISLNGTVPVLSTLTSSGHYHSIINDPKNSGYLYPYISTETNVTLTGYQEFYNSGFISLDNIELYQTICLDNTLSGYISSGIPAIYIPETNTFIVKPMMDNIGCITIEYESSPDNNVIINEININPVMTLSDDNVLSLTSTNETSSGIVMFRTTSISTMEKESHSIFLTTVDEYTNVVPDISVNISINNNPELISLTNGQAVSLESNRSYYKIINGYDYDIVEFDEIPSGNILLLDNCMPLSITDGISNKYIVQSAGSFIHNNERTSSIDVITSVNGNVLVNFVTPSNNRKAIQTKIIATNNISIDQIDIISYPYQYKEPCYYTSGIMMPSLKPIINTITNNNSNASGFFVSHVPFGGNCSLYDLEEWFLWAQSSGQLSQPTVVGSGILNDYIHGSGYFIYSEDINYDSLYVSISNELIAEPYNDNDWWFIQ